MAEQAFDAFCDLTGIDLTRLKRVPAPSLAESAIADEDLAVEGQLHGTASNILMKALWYARLCRADVMFAASHLATRVTQWLGGRISSYLG